MILTNLDIQERIGNKIKIEPFEQDLLQGASYDFRIGKQGATTSSRKLINIEQEGHLFLEPGDFAIVIVLEKLSLDIQHTGRFSLKSKHTRVGLIAASGLIDPGYEGRLVIGLTNSSHKPVSLLYMDELISLEFHQLEKPSTKPYSGLYQKKYELVSEDVEGIIIESMPAMV